MSPAEAATGGVAGAVAFGLFTWWFSTGAILWVVSQRGALPRAATWFTLPMLGAAVAGLARSGLDTSVWGAFEAFSTAILIWGWFELAFLAGVIVGPDRRGCPEGVTGWRRFVAAWRALSHHELALAGMMALIWLMLRDQPNQIGLATFAVLFFARISAKLNVFLGVPNLTEEFLPPAVAHLKTFFAKRRMNAVFPFSITLLTIATWALGARAFDAPDGSGEEAGFILVATLCGLALVEHWLMVLNVQDAALWRWVMPAERRGSIHTAGEAAATSRGARAAGADGRGA